MSPNNLKHFYLVKYPREHDLFVEREGSYYEAYIKDTRDGFHLIHYVGQSDYWDEWVTYDRIVRKRSKKGKMDVNGKSYPITVLESDSDKYFIHYQGYDSSWDEWVGADRIRFEN